MRRRSTFIHSATEPFDFSEIEVRSRQVLHLGIRAAREERLTFGFNELPTETISLLRQSHELHIRWSPETSPGSISPYLSRLTPGLHVHYTPLKNNESSSLLCPLLRKTFGPQLKCQSPDVSFSRPDVLSDRFASSSSSQYYSLLPSLNHFADYVKEEICSPSDKRCKSDAELLKDVDYIDFDYDSISHALILTAFWSKAPPAIYDSAGQIIAEDQWPIDISSTSNGKVEIGLLANFPPINAHDLQLGGVLIVVGEDSAPKSTQFSFPSRHHILSRSQAAEQSYKVSFDKPTGLHPTLRISFPSATSLAPPTHKPADSICALHAYFTLPSSIFADNYAFSANDPLFEQSHNLRGLRSISGELDLEAPDYVVQRWGSAMLLELATPEGDLPIPSGSWNVTVPLHLRYQPPVVGGMEEVQVPWPTLFWACTADEGTKFPGNPFDRVNLGYDGIFGARTMFYHLKPAPPPKNNGRLVEHIKVPVLDTSKVGGDVIVERGTLIVILLSFGWVLYKLWPGLKRQFSAVPVPTQKNIVDEKKTK